MWRISPQTHLDREDESRQSEAEGVCVDKAAEGPDDVVLGGLRADVHSGVLDHCGSSRLSREPIIPPLQGNSLTLLTSRIHHCYLNCSLECAPAGRRSVVCVWSGVCWFPFEVCLLFLGVWGVRDIHILKKMSWTVCTTFQVNWKYWESLQMIFKQPFRIQVYLCFSWVMVYSEMHLDQWAWNIDKSSHLNQFGN